MRVREWSEDWFEVRITEKECRAPDGFGLRSAGERPLLRAKRPLSDTGAFTILASDLALRDIGEVIAGLQRLKQEFDLPGVCRAGACDHRQFGKPCVEES